jgi:hypothetical protein
MGGWQINWEQKGRGSCGQALPHSESTANLLMRNGANFDIFSECALILLANWSDFDSAIRRFDSSRPSQPVRSPEISPTMSPRSPPLAAFLPLAKSLRVPNLPFIRPAVPKISTHLRHCGRFLEKQSGNLVRSHCVTDVSLHQVDTKEAHLMEQRFSVRAVRRSHLLGIKISAVFATLPSPTFPLRPEFR